MKNEQTCNSRIALRLPSNQKKKLEKLILEGKAKNISQLTRALFEEFLGEN